MMKNIGIDYIDYMKRKIEYWEDQSNKLFGRNINHVLLIHANALNAEYYDELCQMIREKKNHDHGLFNSNFSFIKLVLC